jgi:hypothetical protein
LTFFEERLLKKLTKQFRQTAKIFLTRKEVNVMGDMVESLMAVMGVAAGLMVVLSTLLSGNTLTEARQRESHHAPHSLRLNDVQRAA